MTDIETTWIDQFKEAWHRGVQGFIDAGKIYAEAVRRDRQSAESELAKIGFVLTDRIRLEKLGNGQLDVRLFEMRNRAAQRLSGFPVQEQTRAIECGVPVLLVDRPQEHIMVPVLQLTPAQVQQVFAADHIRSEGEQRQYIEAEKLKAIQTQPVKVEPYVISGNRLRVKANTSFTRQDLLEILVQMGG